MKKLILTISITLFLSACSNSSTMGSTVDKKDEGTASLSSKISSRIAGTDPVEADAEKLAVEAGVLQVSEQFAISGISNSLEE